MTVNSATLNIEIGGCLKIDCKNSHCKAWTVVVARPFFGPAFCISRWEASGGKIILFAGVAGPHARHQKIKKLRKILKSHHGTKRSPPSGMGGGRCVASGEGLSQDKGKCERKRSRRSEAKRTGYNM